MSKTVGSSSVTLATTAQAFQLLGKHGVGQEAMQLIIDDQDHRCRVAEVMTEKATVDAMTRRDWLNREGVFMYRLTELGLPKPNCKVVESSYVEGYGFNHSYIPDGLSRRNLLSALLTAGVGINCSDVNRADSISEIEQIKTEAGVIQASLMTLLLPIDATYRPLSCSYDEQLDWVKETGGDCLPSVEEHLYLLLRTVLEFGYIPSIGQSCRCRNEHSWSPSSTAVVHWFDKGELNIGCTKREKKSYRCATWTRILTKE